MQTNYDNIMSMDKFALADFLENNIDCLCCPVRIECKTAPNAIDCSYLLLRWLEKPAK